MNKKIKLLPLLLIASIFLSACTSTKPNAELTLVKQEQLVLGTLVKLVLTVAQKRKEMLRFPKHMSVSLRLKI